MKSFSRRLFFFTAPLFLFSLSSAAVTTENLPAPLAAATAPTALRSGAVPVVVWGRTLTSYRLAMEFTDVHQRAEAAEQRVTHALSEIDVDKLIVQPVQIGEAHGFAISAGPVYLIKIMEGDLDTESGASLTTTVTDALDQIRSLVRDHAAQYSVSLMIRAIIQAVIATVLFAAFWIFAVWLKSLILRRIVRSTEAAGHVFRIFGYDWRPVLIGIISTTTQLLMFGAVLGSAYIWTTFVLNRFPYTRHWGEQLGAYLMDAVSGLATGAVNQIPNLAALIVIYLLTRGVIRVLNGWFTAIESGKQLTGWLDPEAARATRRLANIGIWIVAVIVAFPYLPGADSEAFKGISVFLGLMLSLGGAGFVGQVIGGLAAIYSRAVRSGDYIIVGSTEGIVKELGLLTTKVITRTREEVTIPNSMLISSAIRNFSRSCENSILVSTSVTIGYDTPWRQVQAMLLEAADQTGSILKEPAPVIRQTALNDFYVCYELTACSLNTSWRGDVVDQLHGKIQDIFNTHGVQIMSPHFRSQPATSVVVPKDRWHPAPAKPPQ